MTKKFNQSEIRNLRKSLGLSQRQFAKLVGVSKRTVTYWESGKTSPGEDVLSKLAELPVNNGASVKSGEEMKSESVNSGEEVENESVKSKSVKSGEEVNSDENVTSDENETNQTHGSGENKTPDADDETKLNRKSTGGKRRSPFVQSVLDQIPIENEIGKDVQLKHSSNIKPRN